MTGPELGFLLLTSHLGDPGRRPLSPAQVETVTAAVRLSADTKPRGEVTEEALMRLGLPRELCLRVPMLLQQEALARSYLALGQRLGLRCITRKSPDYPGVLAVRMGPRAPGVLWAGGSVPHPRGPKIALVGSRDLHPENREFARAVGREAAKQGFTLVSGNAIGADRAAQDAALSAGGAVISVLPGAMGSYPPPSRNQMYLWEDSFDLPFTSQRALWRNHIIHAMGDKALVAQVSDGHGGTWSGSMQNLKHGYSPLFVFQDGSHGAALLAGAGATYVTMQDLGDLASLSGGQADLYEI